MADNEQIMALLQQIAQKVDARGVKLDAQGAKLDAQGESLNTKIDGVAKEQAAMRTEMNNKFERVSNRLDNLNSLALRAAIRADDALSAQARMQTDISAIRERLENGDRQLGIPRRYDGPARPRRTD
jgi:uncharacterized coiled-coil DUF342 family protein